MRIPCGIIATLFCAADKVKRIVTVAYVAGFLFTPKGKPMLSNCAPSADFSIAASARRSATCIAMYYSIAMLLRVSVSGSLSYSGGAFA